MQGPGNQVLRKTSTTARSIPGAGPLTEAARCNHGGDHCARFQTNSIWPPLIEVGLRYFISLALIEVMIRSLADARQHKEDKMKTQYTVALSMIAGAALGAAAIQGLHAQAKPH